MEAEQIKEKKFKLCKNFRYLVGTVPFEKCVVDLKQYNNHRYKVFAASPRVDDTPLPMSPYKYIKKSRMVADAMRLKQIDRENKNLIKKISLINRIGGKVDSFNPLAYKRTEHWIHHQRKLKEIDWENKIIHKLITEAKSYYNSDDMNKRWIRTFKVIEHACKMPYEILNKISIDETLKACPSISEGLERGNAERPLCFMEFQEKGGRPVGQITIELYYDHVPVTVQNFLEICNGDNLSYKNCLVHRIVKGQFLETGDITKGTGRGGFSIYGETFHEENHMLKHTRAGIVSMKRIGMSENNSQFCITFRKLDKLDHKNVVFGKVIRGNDVLFKIEDYGRNIGKPYAEIIISKCGQLPAPTNTNL